MLRIKKVLKEKGIPQAELARRCELTPQAMSRIALGYEPAWAKRGRRIAEALGWEGDPAELFQEVADDD